MSDADVTQVTRTVPLTVGLTRAHYRRLRWYWTGKTFIASSLTDGTDLDLAGLGLIARRERHLGGVVAFCITPEGEAELALERQREIARRQPHHDLGEKLAEWLRVRGRMTWENIEFKVETDRPPAAVAALAQDGRWRSVVRPDVFSVVTTYDSTRLRPQVHEIKTSRADFLVDVANPDKRYGYSLIADGVFYTCEKDLIRADEIPPECGLVYHTGDGAFDVVKKPPRRRVSLTPANYMNLVLKPGRARDPV